MFISEKEQFQTAISEFLCAINPENQNLLKNINAGLRDLCTQLNNRSGDDGQPENEENESAYSIQPTFNYKQLKAYDKILNQYFYPDIRHVELFSIANIIATKCPELKLTRKEKRSKPLLFKWFDDHWEEIEPYLGCMIVASKDGDILNKNKPNQIDQVEE